MLIYQVQKNKRELRTTNNFFVSIVGGNEKSRKITDSGRNDNPIEQTIAKDIPQIWFYASKNRFAMLWRFHCSEPTSVDVTSFYSVTCQHNTVFKIMIMMEYTSILAFIYYNYFQAEHIWWLWYL